MTDRVGLYPGTFDPITLGHADIIRRGAKLVDRLIVGVTTNPSKDPMFSPEERIEMVRAEVERLGIGNVEVEGFNALLVKYARKIGATVLIRGLRAVAPIFRAYLTSSALNPSTSTLPIFSRPTSARTMSIRSSGANIGSLEGLVVTPTISRSTSLAPRRMISAWPSVIGSKVPGYSPMR